MKAVIVGICLLALAVMTGAVVVGLKSYDGEVSDTPYQEGLTWDAARRQQIRLGWTAELETAETLGGETRLRFVLRGRDGEPLEAELRSVTLTRPDTSRYDERLTADPLGTGRFEVPVRFPGPGRWRLALHVAKDGESLILELPIDPVSKETFE